MLYLNIGPRLKYCADCDKPYERALRHNARCAGEYVYTKYNNIMLFLLGKCKLCCKVQAGPCPPINGYNGQLCSSCNRW